MPPKTLCVHVFSSIFRNALNSLWRHFCHFWRHFKMPRIFSHVVMRTCLVNMANSSSSHLSANARAILSPLQPEVGGLMGRAWMCQKWFNLLASVRVKKRRGSWKGLTVRSPMLPRPRARHFCVLTVFMSSVVISSSLTLHESIFLVPGTRVETTSIDDQSVWYSVFGSYVAVPSVKNGWYLQQVL